MIGFEIRRPGKIENIYRDVDIILRKPGPPIEVSAAAHGIQKLLTQRTFYCTDVETCAKAVNLVIPAERSKVYRAIHCVEWSEMVPEFREKIIAMVMDDFRPVFMPDAAVQ